MGIDLYVYSEEKAKRLAEIENYKYEDWKKSKEAENLVEEVYIRESYHGHEHAVWHFVPETESGEYVYIPSATLEKRMEVVRHACMERSRGYGGTTEEIKAYADGHYALFEKALAFVKSEEELGRKAVFLNSY